MCDNDRKRRRESALRTWRSARTWRFPSEAAGWRSPRPVRGRPSEQHRLHLCAVSGMLLTAVAGEGADAVGPAGDSLFALVSTPSGRPIPAPARSNRARGPQLVDALYLGGIPLILCLLTGLWRWRRPARKGSAHPPALSNATLQNVDVGRRLALADIHLHSLSCSTEEERLTAPAPMIWPQKFPRHEVFPWHGVRRSA